MEHVLVIGGTGMLFDTSVFLAEHADKFTLLARKIPRRRMHPTKIIPFERVDYCDADRFRRALEGVIQSSGKFTHVLCWMHSDATASLELLMKMVAGAVFWHVKGSATYDPQRQHRDIPMDLISKLDYREVILGFRIENAVSRWLTNEEISDGVIAAVNSGERRIVIGQIEPWSKKP